MAARSTMLGLLAAFVLVQTFIILAAEGQAEQIPLADLHFHPVEGLLPDTILRAMDRAGVRWAGNGASAMGRDDLWFPFMQAAPDRFLPFAGQGAIYMLVRDQGEAAWTLKSPELNRYLEKLEQDLQAGRFRGIGELFVNNVNTRPPAFQGTRYPADSLLMRRLLSLAATYQVPLSIHMEADTGSVEELERLLPIDRKSAVIWAHCGSWAEASLVRRLMTQHPNIFCELSWRDGRRPGPRNPNVSILGFFGRLKSDWKELLEAHSDRFLIGTDSDSLGDYQGIIDLYRNILAQLTPEAARRIAYENAQRLFRLRPPQ